MIYQSSLLDEIAIQLEKSDPFIIRSNGVSISRNQYKRELDFFTYQISSFLSCGDVFSVWIDNEILFSQIILAGLRSGSVACLIDPEGGNAIVKNQILEAKVQYIFIEGKIFDIFFLTRNPLLQLPVQYVIVGFSVFGFRRKKILCGISEVHLPETKKLNENEPSIIVFTGGTTDVPKGVVHTHKSLVATAQNLLPLFSLVKRMYVDMPHFLLFGLLLGIPMVTGKNRFSSRKVFSIIKKYNVDGYFSPPYRYNFLIKKGYVPASLKHIYIGSAPVYYGFLTRLISILKGDQNIHCIYGMTEILPIAMIDGREKLDFGNVAGDILGRVYGNIEVKCRNQEFLVKGPHVSAGYLGDTKKEYISTGDCGYISDGLLVLTGRKKDMIIRKDFNIYPALYESIISKIPGVIEVALVGVYESKNADEKIFLFLEVSGIVYKKETILSLLKKGKYSIDEFALPDEILFMNLPRKGRQKKIDKETLRQFAKKNYLGG
ncbi:MAG: class I adenylate-forming enzyme family protein [Candidatus Altimarinota bacterium]